MVEYNAKKSFSEGGSKVVKRFLEIIEDSSRIVFFGGAGVSTESGIPDFRGEGGLYGLVPEQMISHSYFTSHPERFYEFYRTKMIYPKALPNNAHKALALLEKQGKLLSVITQNIDGLHQAAGSQKVYELHGSVHRNYCTRCGKFYGVEHILSSDTVPMCECGGIVKPDVVLYEEPLDSKTMYSAISDISRCDTLIVGGTSLAVYPAAGLINYFCGKYLVLINKSPTPADSMADVIIRENIGEVMGKLLKE
ncbi:MAG: NAD-dependent protein deacylase [Clostridia bacterium]|nr:NAD-dependent protein deacylase [Clostridia bacterium]